MPNRAIVIIASVRIAFFLSIIVVFYVVDNRAYARNLHTHFGLWDILSNVGYSKVITVVAYKFYVAVNLLQLGKEILHETFAGTLNSTYSHNSRDFKLLVIEPQRARNVRLWHFSG